MNIKGLFSLITFLFFTAFLSQAQVGLSPLNQYSIGNSSHAQLRTTAIVQDDTLKLPYIEDFSGNGLPIDSMSVDIFAPDTLVYRITHLKMHGLKSKDSIRVYNVATDDINISTPLTGIKYVKVINKYSFQLFNDKALKKPAKVLSSRIHYCNWVRIGAGGYSTSPDTLGFVANNGGVFINNDMAINPISIGVATFDGVNYQGTPYSTGDVKGYADNLTSLPFNFSQYNPNDSIYMSFYWQSKSLGDTPISTEFLSLDFKDTSGTWIQVWKKMGNTVTEDTFMIEMIPITDSAYFHKGFQYRFRSYGILYGRFNVWNLDYIYINKGRELDKPYLKDISIISTSRTALKNYTSVPYQHMKSLSVAEITNETGSAFMKIRDRYNDYIDTLAIIIPIKRDYLIRDNLIHNTPSNNVRDTTISGINIQSPLFTQPFADTIIGGYMTEPYVLKEEFSFQPLDTLGPIDLSFNNFAAIETYFHDYYAYDDNSPEITLFTANPGGTNLANAYKILKTDELTHIDYCFIKNNGINLTNSTIIMNVWKAGPKITNASTIKKQAISIKYSPKINGFVRYQLKTPLTLEAGETYYFGYTQEFNDALFVGYDRNNDRSDKIFFSNNGIDWLPISTTLTKTGALMIRPVFSKNEFVTGVIESPETQNRFEIFPNPSSGELHFTGEPEYISIYDLSGLLISETSVKDLTLLSTESMVDGLYVLVLSKGDYKEVKRLIIQK